MINQEENIKHPQLGKAEGEGGPMVQINLGEDEDSCVLHKTIQHYNQDKNVLIFIEFVHMYWYVCMNIYMNVFTGVSVPLNFHGISHTTHLTIYHEGSILRSRVKQNVFLNNQVFMTFCKPSEMEENQVAPAFFARKISQKIFTLPPPSLFSITAVVTIVSPHT